MEAIILTSTQFETLTARIEEIKIALDKNSIPQTPVFIDNVAFIEMMKISTRTAQKWRDEGIISFSQIGNKIYYRMADVQELLNRNFKEALPTTKNNGHSK